MGESDHYQGFHDFSNDWKERDRSIGARIGYVFVFFEDMYNNAAFPGIREEACRKAFIVDSEDDAQGFAAEVGECIYK